MRGPSIDELGAAVGAPARRRRVRSKVGAAAFAATVAGLGGGLVYLGTGQPIATVVSGSMQPTLDVGDVALMGRVRSTPKVGDVVEVPVPLEVQREKGYPSHVVHRIVAVEDGMVATQGDNLGEPDPFEVPLEDIDKRMVTVVPAAGRVFGFLTSPFGLLWLGAGVVLLLGPTALEAMRRSAGDAGKETNATLQEVVAAVGEYGYHLRSHTAILQSMSQAAQDLSSVVAKLEQRVDGDVSVQRERPRVRLVLSQAPAAPPKKKLILRRRPVELH